MHWYGGSLGYFPTYTLGNLYSAQLMEAADRALGGVDAQLARGEFLPLLGWMREHIHAKGSLASAEDIARAATGKSLGPADRLAHLRRKYSELYAL